MAIKKIDQKQASKIFGGNDDYTVYNTQWGCESNNGSGGCKKLKGGEWTKSNNGSKK